MDWRQFQEQTAILFRRLGCQADIEVDVAGARGQHRIDVLVQFRKFGLETNWVIECKNWSSPVTKEKVLALKSVVEDIGADRGILISAAGFQSGAISYAKNTNITLTELEQLRSDAQEELISALIHQIDIRILKVQRALSNLHAFEPMGEHGGILRPLPGVDGDAVIRAIGKLSLLQSGLNAIRLKEPPYAVKFNETGNRTVAVNSVDDFIVAAKAVIDEVESTWRNQQGPKAA